MKDYQTVQDFVMDASFCHWVRGTDPNAGAYWQALLEEYPEKAALIRQARTIVLDLNTGGEQLAEDEKAAMWFHIMAGKAAAETPAASGDIRPARLFQLYRWGSPLGVAAGLTAILMLSIGVFWMLTQQSKEIISYRTRYGEIKNITLPDGSEVVLNANSKLTFEKGWDDQTTREVQLSGEAYFKVRHKANKQKFQVKLSDNLKVEVLGTEFTVTQWPRMKRVVLSEGKVKMVRFQEKMFGLVADTRAEATLKPGELIKVNERTGELEKRKAENTEAFAAFRYHKIMFYDTSLAEVARVLEDSYGYKVTFTNSDLLLKRFTGTAPANQIETLFVSLEKLFHLTIHKDGKQVTIS
ncbi:FecR domain-containing protein [Pontibacter sp. 172403-2]|uniref:FecR family protein n=1 Tax=Pontibacter rufus TaxID=2791028 RepID=UPI0018AF5A5C|nr:FecR domain-containing protein [Pontibacter sp. 172403-2]MBF9254604.1 FecR domain-containing protein [Pontibacter sp. 172403-2]